MSERPTSSTNTARFGWREWAIYYVILSGTFFAVLVITASLIGALVAVAGAVLSATHAAAMTQRVRARRR